MSQSSVSLQPLNIIQAVRFAHVSAGSLFFFDYCLTIFEEIELIWMSPLSMGKVIFVLNRYYALCTIALDFYGIFPIRPTDAFCNMFYPWLRWSSVIVCLLTQGILQLRVYALFRQNFSVKCVMVVSWLSLLAICIVIMTVRSSSVPAVIESIPGGLFCIFPNLGGTYIQAWIPILVYESIIGLLALLRSIQLRKAAAQIGRPSTSTGVWLANVIFEDSLLFFVAIRLISFWCVIMWTTVMTAFWEVPLGYAVALPSILANRMILNIRRTANKQVSLPKITPYPVLSHVSEGSEKPNAY